MRRSCLGVIALLYVASVPWYREADEPLRLLAGLPDWVAVALGCYVAVAALNAVAWLLTDVSDENEDALEVLEALRIEAPAEDAE